MQQIGRVWLNWENALAQDYSIQLSSDGSSWNTIYTTTNGPGTINDLAAPGSGRYVRMYGTQRSTPYGYSLWEFEVFPALAPQPAITLSGTNVVISWPNTLSNWSLQTSPVLGVPGSWSNIATTPFSLDSEYMVTDTVSGPVRFYRLKQNP